MGPGSHLGPYEILSALGAGGMGEVFRAHDTKLNRDVAIKVLLPAVANDPDRLARFSREAQVLASLNHPNIAHIHGLEESDGTRALVMELVEGPTLADRIAHGAIPLGEALPIAKQIAEALEAAHEQGIIHRDLKPANIKVRDDGTVKVLDFGLAKALDRGSGIGAQGSVDAMNSPTISMHATQAGIILGTAAYMSPEQATGKPVDKRSDLWAFGVVLLEMLTGKRVFAGETVSHVLACVLKDDPDWTTLPADTPASIRRLLRRCLEKDRKRRLADASDARLEIEEALTEPPATQRRAILPVSLWRWMIPGFAVFVMIGAVIGWLTTRTSREAPSVAHLQISLQPADQLTGSIASVRPSRTAFALSPDGTLLVFSGTRGTTPPQPQLFSRGLAQAEATPIPGTEDGVSPFFSPDGRWIGFFARGQIKKVPVAGGPPVVICDVTRGLFGASWADDGTILFSDGGAGISRVSSVGGGATAITTSDAAKGERHILPQPVPGGKAVIFTETQTAYAWEKVQIVLQSLETGERRALIQGGVDARYVPTGHLVYMKAGTLMAVPFDARTLGVVGDPQALMEGVMQAVNAANSNDETGAGQFMVANSGTLIYVTGGVHTNLESSLVWVDRHGAAQPVPSAPIKSYLSPRLSPDEGRVAILIAGGDSFTQDVWVYDALRGAATSARLTFSRLTWPVIWSPDGKRLVFGSSQSGAVNLHMVNADGSGQIERLTTSEYDQFPSSWAGQGNLIAFLEDHRPNFQIWVLPMEGDRKPRLFLDSRFSLEYPEFSPDGRSIAYVSPESGTNEVYVQPYPGPGEKYRISTTGGTQPIWVANGRELLYRSGYDAAKRAVGMQPGYGEKFFSVAITSLDPFRTAAPRLLFEARPNEYDSTGGVRCWDVSRDGQRFLLLRGEPKDKPVTQLQIVLNWTEELKRRVPVH